MKPFTRDVLTGATTIIGAGAMIVLLGLFGEFSTGGERWRFTLRMNTARGLSTLSPVTLNGVPVGSIESLRPAPDPTDGVDVTVSVRDDVSLPRGFVARIEQGLVGDATLDLGVGHGADPSPVEPGETVERRAITLLVEITELMERPLATLEAGAESFKRFAETYTSVGERLEEMLAERTPEQVAAGEEPNIASTIATAHRTLAAAREVIDDARLWVGDEDLRGGAHEIAERASRLLDEATQAVDRWRRVAETVDQRTTEVAADVGAARDALTGTLDSLSRTNEELRVMLAAINEGEGTLGQLARNPDLYRTLEATSLRLDAVLTELQLLIEKYRKEGVPVQF